MTETLTMFEGDQAIAFMEVCQERDVLALKLSAESSRVRALENELFEAKNNIADGLSHQNALEARLSAESARAERATAEAAVLLKAIQDSVVELGDDLWTDAICVMENFTPLATAHIAEFAALRANQRMSNTDEVCQNCGDNVASGKCNWPRDPTGAEWLYPCPLIAIRQEPV